VPRTRPIAMLVPRPGGVGRVGRRRVASFGLLLATALLVAGPMARTVAGAGGLTMTAHVLLQGHTRVGSWMAIEVHLTNDGPAVKGEVGMTGGSLGQTHFAVAVDLPTQSDQRYVLYGQPPSFGQDVTVALVSSGKPVASAKAAFVTHDATQLVVGILAERPQAIVGELALQPSAAGTAPAIVSLGVADLPDRLEGWSALDRLIWQDVDTNTLSHEQLAALEGWLSAGGQLVVVGGTAGAAALNGLPETILPYRPMTTVDAAASDLTGVIGQLPADATDLPALSGSLSRGRSLARHGADVIAAQSASGAGSVTLLGFDPTTPWLAASKSVEGLWRRLLPQRSAGGPLIASDDTQMVSAVSQLPSLAVPPIGGLLILLAAYVLLVGPLNYIVLRRLDRREWAWITMPALIVGFAVAAYGFGSLLRGTDVIVSQVAVVRGAPDSTVGAAQVYFGIFSPSRGNYEVDIPGGALLSSPIASDFGGGGSAANIDVIQGNPARIRDLAVGFGSLRTVRADSATTVPRITADLSLVDGKLQGTVKNASTERLDAATLVLGSSIAALGNIEPGREATVSLSVGQASTGEALSDRVVGQVFNNGAPTDSSETTQRLAVRHAVVDQLTWDPNFGRSDQLAADGPVLLAWDSRSVLDVRISGQSPRQIGNVLYYIPVEMRISGTTTFSPDLIRSTIVASDATFFKGGPANFNTGAAFGAGSVTVAYRPVAFQGLLSVKTVSMGLNFGGPGAPITGQPEAIGPACVDASGNALPCASVAPARDNLPEVEVFDRAGSGQWFRLPHMTGGRAYDLQDPGRYVDPASGTLLVRFVNGGQDSVGFSFSLSITGDIE
jgi:hypothetical protein